MQRAKESEATNPSEQEYAERRCSAALPRPQNVSDTGRRHVPHSRGRQSVLSYQQGSERDPRAKAEVKYYSGRIEQSGAAKAPR